MAEPYHLKRSIVSDRSKSRANPDDILDENELRWVSLPIYFNRIWTAYKAHEAHMWTAEDVDLSEMVRELSHLSEPLREAYRNVLALECAAIFGPDEKDPPANMERILFKLDKCLFTSEITNDVQIPEARAFYGFQASYENILMELNSVALLNSYDENESKFHACVDEISQDPLSVKRALLWLIHVCRTPQFLKGSLTQWISLGEGFIGSSKDISLIPPSIQERVVCTGVLKWINTLGARILKAIFQERFPALKGSSTEKVLTYTIDTAKRHLEFSIMLHKSFSDPLERKTFEDLIDAFLAIENQILESKLFREVFRSQFSENSSVILSPKSIRHGEPNYPIDENSRQVLNDYSIFTELVMNERLSLVEAYYSSQTGTVTSSGPAVTILATGLEIEHFKSQIEGDVRDDPNKSGIENETGGGNAQVAIDEMNFTIDGDSDF